MRVEEICVQLEEAEKIFDIIESALEKNTNSQIFIDDSILKEFRKNGKHHVFLDDKDKKHQYNNREEWYKLTTGEVYEDTLAKASFDAYCQGYHNLIQFKKEGSTLYYMQSLFGLEQILIIKAEHNKKRQS